MRYPLRRLKNPKMNWYILVKHDVTIHSKNLMEYRLHSVMTFRDE